MTDSEDSELALDMYAEASGKTSQLQVATVEMTEDSAESLADSADEDTETADKYNRQRRENAKLRKLEAKTARQEQENKLRVDVATRIVEFVAGQLILTNMMIWTYFLVMLARAQTIPSEVIIAWLSSTIVEILGLLWVIARSLFPFKDKYRDMRNEKQAKTGIR